MGTGQLVVLWPPIALTSAGPPGTAARVVPVPAPGGWERVDPTPPAGGLRGVADAYFDPAVRNTQ